MNEYDDCIECGLSVAAYKQTEQVDVRVCESCQIAAEAAEGIEED